MSLEKTLIYCGGNYGKTLRRIVHDYTKVVVFEPHPRCCAELIRVLPPWVIVNQAALGAENGFGILNDYAPTHQSASLGTMTQQVEEFLEKQRPGYYQLITKIPVMVINLYDWWRRFYHAIGSDFVIDKLITDCQGMDLTIMKTMEPMLETRKIIEFTCEVDDEVMPHYNLYNGEQGFMGLMKKYPRYSMTVKEQNGFQSDITWSLKG